MKAIINLTKNILKMPKFWVFWVLCLFLVNMTSLFFLHHLEGKIVLASFMVAGTLMPYLNSKFGYVRLLGLAHLIPWIPLLIWLYTRIDLIKQVDNLYKWILLLFLFNGISVIIDIIDVIKYFRGQKGPTV